MKPVPPPGLVPGTIVCSLAGRDKGKVYVVLRIAEREALLADGTTRPIERPKRKNPRHLQPVEPAGTQLAERLARGQAATNEDIRREIEASASRRGVTETHGA